MSGLAVKATRRKRIPTDARQAVLHECGYMCANPACRTVLTLDTHHMQYVSNGGGNEPSNLLVICKNCHAHHHAGHIKDESIRAWKMLMMAINEAFNRDAVSTLLMLFKLDGIVNLKTDGIVNYAALIASSMVDCTMQSGIRDSIDGVPVGPYYTVKLSSKGEQFVKSWIKGDQEAAIYGEPTLPFPSQ